MRQAVRPVPLSVEEGSISRRTALLGSAAALAPWCRPAAAAGVLLEGVRLSDSVVSHGQRLVLNGAGMRKRGYFKSNVVALYLPERRTTVEAIYRLDGPRRIQIHTLRDFSSATISRYFIADFKQAASDAEFKQLIDVVAAIGAVYNGIKKIGPGDLVNVDWVPKVGLIPYLNDDALTTTPINSPLAYEIYLRMFIGKHVPDDLRNALLGLNPQGTPTT